MHICILEIVQTRLTSIYLSTYLSIYLSIYLFLPIYMLMCTRVCHVRTRLKLRQKSSAQFLTKIFPIVKKLSRMMEMAVSSQRS